MLAAEMGVLRGFVAQGRRLAVLLVLAGGLFALLGAVVVDPAVAQASTCGAAGAFSSAGPMDTCTYSSTGGEDTFTAPSGVSAVTVRAVGGPGGFSVWYTLGGYGAAVTATLPVSAETSTLYVEVGGSAGYYDGTGGFNGGGTSFSGEAGGGGGASDVRTCSRSACSDLSSDDTRLVVAGGGGGGAGTGYSDLSNTGGTAGDVVNGGVSGTGPGAAERQRHRPCHEGRHGGFGRQRRRRRRGRDLEFPTSGQSGSLGQGGSASSGSDGYNYAGAGGGGYWGGGAGGDGACCGGGGAGSSFWVSSATSTSMAEDTTATPQVAISYTRPASASETAISASPASIPANGYSTSTITVQAKDANGNDMTVSGGTVTLSTDLGSVSGVTDNMDGTYTATLTSGATAGTAHITGTIRGAAIANPTSVAFTPASVAVGVSPTSIAANGTSTAKLTVHIKDGHGHPVSGAAGQIVLQTGADGPSFGAVSQSAPGVYTATVTSSTNPGTFTITATDTGVSGTTQLRQSGRPRVSRRP